MLANALRAVSRQRLVTRKEMWPDETLGQFELVMVFHLHQVQPERVRGHPAGTTHAAFEHFLAHSGGRSPAPMVISTPAMLRTM